VLELSKEEWKILTHAAIIQDTTFTRCTTYTGDNGHKKYYEVSGPDGKQTQNAAPQYKCSTLRLAVPTVASNPSNELYYAFLTGTKALPSCITNM
jgi:hypothetical protein